MKIAAEMKTSKPKFPKIRHDLLDRLSEKAEELTVPVPPQQNKSDEPRRWAA